MKKLLLVFAVFALIMASCKEETTGPQEEAYAEFSITANEADLVNLKSVSDDPVPICIDFTEEYAYVKVSYEVFGVEEDLTLTSLKQVSMEVYDVLTFDGSHFATEVIKVEMGSYKEVEVQVTEFLLFTADDVLRKATPHAGSMFYGFINPENGLRSLKLQKFTKTEWAIDVLCYDVLTYDYFGFIWFDIRPITVRSVCVFGDICYCYPESYMSFESSDGVSYKDQIVFNNGIFGDLIAYTRVTVDHSVAGMPTNTYTNVDFDPINNCLEVKWADIDEDPDDEVTITLEVLLPVDGDLKWVVVKTITGNATDPFIDGEGEDGMIDFVIGDCHDEADFVLPAHIILPSQLGNVWMDSEYSDVAGFANHTAKFSFTGIPAGYSVVDGVDYYGWCLNANQPTPGSGNVTLLRASDFDNTSYNGITRLMIDRLTYLVNNSSLIANGVPTVGNGTKLQQLVWALCGAGVPASVQTEFTSITSMVGNAGVYTPGVGEFQLLCAYKSNGIQIFVTKVESPCVDVFADIYPID